jgi:glycosyltransferase involved in cell wall biosynthesis
VISRIGVVIPARNEAERIDACLRSVLVAACAIREPVEVVVVADGCTDDTAAAARAHGVHVIETEASNVGFARSIGVDALLADGCDWIANTDADSVVPREWLGTHRILARRGADVVVGAVRPDFADLDAASQRFWLDSHTHGEAIGHVHGANLSFSARIYREAGGYAAISEHEDNDLVERMSRAGNVVATGLAVVTTSGRLVGRTAGGYAGYLRRMATAAADAEPNRSAPVG